VNGRAKVEGEGLIDDNRLEGAGGGAGERAGGVKGEGEGFRRRQPDELFVVKDNQGVAAVFDGGVSGHGQLGRKVYCGLLKDGRAIVYL